MQRRIYLACCAAAFVIATILGEKALFGHYQEMEAQGVHNDIDRTQQRISDQTRKLSENANTRVREVQLKIDAAIADAQRKAAARRKTYEEKKAILDREIAARSEVVESFAYAADAGHSELADDLKALEEGLAKLRAESARIKRLHEAFNRRQFMSKSVRHADKAVESIEEALAYAEGRLKDAAALSVHADAASNGSNL